ncbi:MAG: lipid-A-disaccharide synthase N-terminal domain-containing protein [Bacteroidales bacterium]|nr:lipid-A-disaccharide synthase N-terminal domain-containing protein [Bacteroidales bacterium]
MLEHLAILAIGFLAQVFFSARIIVQWIMSERAHRVLSPSAFWVFSIAGSYLLFIYGWLRSDFAIILGQFVSYFIYLWNLRAKGIWATLPLWLKGVLLFTPLFVVVMVGADVWGFVTRFFCNEGVPLWMLLFGSAGQVLFTLRFVVQWLHSRALGESQLPASFWIISLVGSLIIVSYGIMRQDLVLIVGQSFGLVAYVRNLCIIREQRRRLK